jgi:antitoxin component YwqK of YwqJK toxin-antitoxin module
MKSTPILTIVLLLLMAVPVLAQPVATSPNKLLYFDNGQKRFDGDYHFAFRQSKEALGLEMDPVFTEGNVQTPREEGYEYLSFAIIFKGKFNFYFPDGKKRAEGVFEDGVRNGKFRFFYPNGKPSSERYYDEGMPTGKWQYWYDDGTLKATVGYEKVTTAQRDSLFTALTFAANETRGQEIADYKGFYGKTEGQLEETEAGRNYNRKKIMGELMNSPFNFFRSYIISYAHPDGPAVFYYPNGKKKAEVMYSHGEPTGTWTYYAENETERSMRLEKGQVVAVDGAPVAEYIAERARNQNAAMQDKVFTSVEQMPEFPGGVQALREYINNNMKPLTDTASGKATVKFTVGLDGKLNDIKFMRSISKESDAEITRMLQAMPAWRPGKQNGVQVKVYYTLPVNVNRK